MSDRPSPALLAVSAAGALLLWRAHRKRYDLRGRVALITGGSRGLGLLLARELAAHGCHLVICARDQRELDVAREELVELRAAVLALRCDVANEEDVAAMVDAAVQRFGRIDILINNAGVIQVGPLETMSSEDFREAMAINFGGVLNTCLAVIPQMRERREGRIVNITSIGGKVAIPHLLPYDCAKFATVGLSEGLRAELARYGIRVSTIVPGLMRTGSPVNAFFKGNAEREFAWFALGSATPLSTINGRRAARRIVRALRAGEAFVTITWQAKTLRMLHALFPGGTAAVLALVNRLLPNANGGGSQNIRGMRLTHVLAPSPLTVLMNRAARNNNEFGGTPDPTPLHARKIGLR